MSVVPAPRPPQRRLPGGSPADQTSQPWCSVCSEPRTACLAAVHSGAFRSQLSPGRRNSDLGHRMGGFALLDRGRYEHSLR